MKLGSVWIYVLVMVIILIGFVFMLVNNYFFSKTYYEGSNSLSDSEAQQLSFVNGIGAWLLLFVSVVVAVAASLPYEKEKKLKNTKTWNAYHEEVLKNLKSKNKSIEECNKSIEECSNNNLKLKNDNENLSSQLLKIEKEKSDLEDKLMQIQSNEVEDLEEENKDFVLPKNLGPSQSASQKIISMVTNPTSTIPTPQKPTSIPTPQKPTSTSTQTTSTQTSSNKLRTIKVSSLPKNKV